MSEIDINTAYKLSHYNLLLEIEDKKYIYNYISGGFGELNSELGNKLKNDCKDNIIKADTISNEKFLDDLKKGEMIHIEDFNELNYLKSVHFTSRFSNINSFGVTIAPTMACNFRCTYCFERNKEYPSIRMSEDIINKTLVYLKEKMPKDGLMNLNWFGGEPLVAFDIIEKMQIELNSIAKEKHTNLLSSMITNGYLLTKEVCDKMINLGILNIQVTVDGIESIHNKLRPLANGGGTFKTIIHNIINADERMRISLRVNVSNSNIEFMGEFLDTLKEYKMHTKKNISVYFSLVKDFDSSSCNTCPNNYLAIDQYADEEIKLYELLVEKGFTMPKRIRPMLASCGAVSPNAILIEADGSLQTCWNCIGDKEKRVGSLDEVVAKEQKDLFLNNKLKWLSWTPFEDKKCVECKTLPVCMDGCPYYSIYNPEGKYKYNCNSLKFNIEKMLKLIIKNTPISNVS